MKRAGLVSTLTALVISVVFSGCGTHTHDEEEHHHEAVSVTLWTDTLELFMEYPQLVTGTESPFIIHLTDMRTFMPVTEGVLKLHFTEKTSGEQFTLQCDSPTNPGIYRPTVMFRKPGKYLMTLHLKGNQVSGAITVDNIAVYKDTASVPHNDGQHQAEEQITFLKEQQWKIDFRTEPVAKRELAGSVSSVGELQTNPRMYAEVPAPVEGFILAEQRNSIPHIGTWVSKGSVLVFISPPSNSGAGLIDIRNDYILAKSELERAERLLARKAIPQKKYDEAKLRYEAKKASYDVIAKQADLDESDPQTDAGFRYQLTAPIDGYVEEIHFRVGQAVSTGQRLFTINNPQRIILKLQVSLSNLELVRNSRDASFKAEGLAEEFSVSKLKGKLISTGSIVNSESRTVPVYFEISNPTNKLKAGMFIQAEIKTGTLTEVLAVPSFAIFEEQGEYIAYVHTEGESFSKRILKTGITDNGYVEILEGLKPGERVVTAGGYQLKLASMSTSVPSGHGHEH